MKNKLLLFLLFFSFLGNKISAKNFEQTLNNSKINLQLPFTVNLTDTIKKSSRALKTSKSTAIIPPPQTTAGSACKEDSDLSVKVSMAASGGSGDVIEWFSSQTSNTLLHTGSIYSPSVSQTTTYYVRSHAGADFSVRVPVVASIYSAPLLVSLSVLPSDSVICEGTPLIFTANGGADLFEFSVDGIVQQVMSANRTFETTTLKKGQIVSVRTRYAVNFDGTITETAWGKGSMEDNILSASLSSNAVNGYINSVKISPTENKLVFGIAGKLDNNRSLLLFLDTKPGGFNLSNYGDEVNVIPSVKGFNYFNNNPSSFDSYFQADYCLAISTDDGGINYFADIIELKTGNSTKVNLGNASTGSPSSVMGVNNGNSGIGDYNLGFEVEVLKSLIGYTVGDIKFFALTMQDDSELNYNVTNSFLSPELSSSLDYGSGAIDYNTKDPNPVVVSADALIPCYKEASILVNLNENPTVATVGSDQYNCTLTSSSLGGNTPSIGTGVWSLKAGPGLVNFSDVNSGTSTATVNVEGIYVFTWTISNGVCPTSTADVKVEFHVPPLTPTASNQTECVSSPIQTLTATATVQPGEKVVWYDALTGGNVVINPTLDIIDTVTYYAEAENETSFCKSSIRTAVTLTLYALPTIAGNLSVCIGATTTLTGSVTADATTPWSSASPAVATVSSLGVITGVSAGTTLITYKNSNGCTTTATVTVNALPIITGSLSVCIGATTTLIGSATGDATTPWISASTGVATVNSSGIVTGVSAGTSLITYKNSDGCTTTSTVTVNDLPTITGVLSVCVGATTILTGSATADATSPWISASTGVATVNSSGVVTGVSAGTSLITYKNSSGCTTTSTVTVNALPIATLLSNDVDNSFCSGTSVIFTAGSGTSYNFRVDGSSVQNGASTTYTTASLTNGQVVDVIVTNASGCTATSAGIINTVNALPTITGTLSVCVGATTALSGSATADATTPWISASTGVATVNSSGVVTGVSAGTSLITYKNSNGCTTTSTVTVNALPIATLSSNDVDDTFCSGTSVTFTAGAGTNYNFRVDGSSVQNGASTTYATTSLTNGQVVDVIVTNASGCTATSTGITNTVNTLPTITGSLSVCVGATTTLTGSATADATTPWISASTGVATVDSSGIVTGLSAGTSLITYKNSNGCTTTATVTVNNLPTITGGLNVCVGATTTLTGSATADATTPWMSASTGVATVNSSGVVTGVSAGTSLITYKNSNGCTTTSTVIVNALPIVTLSSNDVDNTFCSGTSVTFTAGSGVNYNFRVDGSSVQNGASTTYTTASLTNGQVVDVIVTNASGCTATSAGIINTVNALPTITGSLSVCVGATTILSGSATADATTPWISASTGVATVNSSGVVTGVSAGTSLITYKNSNGCTTTSTVTVNALPIATLSNNDVDNSFCSGTSVTFTAGSGTNYNFRVNGSSVQNGTSTTYTTTSLTNGQVVDVIVTNVSGCTATSTGITNTVNALPSSPILVIIKQPTCSVTTGSFTITNYNASYTYAINPSVGVSISGNVVTAPTGNYTVTATLGSCTIGSTQTINPIPQQIQFVINGDCEDKDYVLTASPLSNSYDPNNVDFEWKDSLGATVGTNSNILNVSNLIASTSEKEIFPLNYTLTIMSTSTGCETTNGMTVQTIYCNIQKGISPDGNGSNDNFDLRLMDVKKLEIFDRYGIKVYNQSNYTDQWKGQSDKGEDLPSATYYYVMELNKGETKTGWIYLIREK
jgi:gliding motility-associated-like protein